MRTTRDPVARAVVTFVLLGLLALAAVGVAVSWCSGTSRRTRRSPRLDR